MGGSFPSGKALSSLEHHKKMADGAHGAGSVCYNDHATGKRGNVMTILQYLSAFRLFGGDVLVLGLAVTILVSVLKKTALHGAPKKLFVFLPFALGTVLFAAWRCLAELSAAPLTSGLADTFEGGFACGCAATLYYVIYEQFLRVKPTAVQGTTCTEQTASDAQTSAANATPSANAQAGEAADAANTAEHTDEAWLRTAAEFLGALMPAEQAARAARTLLAGRRAGGADEFTALIAETLARYAPALTEETRTAAAAMLALLQA